MIQSLNNIISKLSLLITISICLSSCASTGSGLTLLGHRDYSSFITPHSLRAKANVTIMDSGLKGRANIFVKSPNFFRIEVLGPFDKTMALMVSDGEGFSIFDGKTFTFYDLSSDPYKLKFKPEEIVSFLIGSLNSQSLDGDYEVSFNEKGFASNIKRFKEGGDAEVELSAKLSNYKEVAGSVVPFSIFIDFNEDKLNIEYKSVEINPKLENNIFIHPNL